MGDACTAIADNPAAMACNPAGLIKSKGTNIYFGTTAIFPSMTYKSPSGVSEDTEDQVFFPPHLYLSSDFGKEDLVFGVGILSPFGLGTKWDRRSLVRYQATESELQTILINPTVAWQLLPTLSVGAGIDYMASRALLENMVDQSLLGASDGESRLKGSGDGWGYNVGILFTPNEKISLGLAYRSGIKVDYDGYASFVNIAPPLQPVFGGSSYRTDADTSVDFPDVLSIGVAYRPTKKIVLALDLERTGWSSYDSLDVDLEGEVPLAGFVDSSETKDWKDVWAIKVGIEYAATEKISLRGGYVYDNTPAPEHTLDPRLPDSDQQNISFGVGYKGENFDIDAVVIAVLYEDREVTNTILSGEYETSSYLLGWSVGYKF